MIRVGIRVRAWVGEGTRCFVIRISVPVRVNVRVTPRVRVRVLGPNGLIAYVKHNDGRVETSKW